MKIICFRGVAVRTGRCTFSTGGYTRLARRSLGRRALRLGALPAGGAPRQGPNVTSGDGRTADPSAVVPRPSVVTVAVDGESAETSEGESGGRASRMHLRLLAMLQAARH